MKGWTHIYVMSCAPGFKKVGLAEDLQRRLAQVRACNPQRVLLDFAREVPQEVARWIEARVHVALVEYRVHGEWFKAPLPHVRRVIWDTIREGEEEAEKRREHRRPILADSPLQKSRTWTRRGVRRGSQPSG